MSLRRANTIARDWYNPLKGLAMSRIVAYEGAAERGQYADLQRIWSLMEQTDVTVQAAIARRLVFIDSIDWNPLRRGAGACWPKDKPTSCRTPVGTRVASAEVCLTPPITL